MTCRELTDFIMAYLDNELEADLRRRFEFHLGTCPACVAFLETYRKTVELGKEAFECPEQEMARERVPEQLIEAILKSIKKPG